MRTVLHRLVQGVLGAGGMLFGVLAAVGLALAAVVPALLGLLAFLLSPIRALLERLRPAGG